MKSKSLITKLLAFMLCVMMVIGCLPVSAFADDWESDIDVVEPAAGSSAESPIEFEFGYRVDTYGFFYTESQSGETFYKTYGRNGEWTFEVSGEGSFSVNYNGETFAAVDGVVSIPVAFTPFANELSFSITGEGEFSLSVAAYIPEGSMNNPVVAQLGDNVASIEAGNNQGFYFTYTADYTGELAVAIDAATGWTYTINNLTAGTYGDAQWNDSDPVVNPAVLNVTAGDELQIIVNTYDPADMWNNPAGDITVNLSYNSLVDADLKFQTIGVSFQDYVGIQCIVNKNLAAIKDKGYEEFYVVATQNVWNSDGTFTEKDADMLVVDYGTRMKFDIQIVSWAMTETVNVTLYAEKDGVVYVGEQFTTSVEELALDKIAGYETSGDSARCTAFVDMLNFGAAVQTSYNHNAENPANRYLEERGFTKWATTEEPAFEKVNSNTEAGIVPVQQAAISLQEKAELQFIFRVPISNYELRYTVDGVTTTWTSEKFEAMSSVITKISIGVKAANFRDEFTVALYDPATGEPVTAIYTVSVEAYAKNNLTGAKRDAYIALMKYGDAVSNI